MRSDHRPWEAVLDLESSPFAACSAAALTILVELSLSPTAQLAVAESVMELPAWLPERDLAGFIAEKARRDQAVGRTLEETLRHEIIRLGQGPNVWPVARIAKAWAELRAMWHIQTALSLLLMTSLDFSVAARKLEIAMAFELRRRAWQALVSVSVNDEN